MRRNRSGQLARMASGLPWWPVGNPMAHDANAVTPCLSPAETVWPPRYGHCPTGLSGRASAYGEHPATSLADSILGHGAPPRRQPRSHEFHSVVDGLDLRVPRASSRHRLVGGSLDASMGRPDGHHPLRPPRSDCDPE
jgi:hypothetical protein